MRPFRLPSTITHEWLKAILQLDPDDDEAEQKIREEIERRMERELSTALGEQMDALIPNGASNAVVAAAPMRVVETGTGVRDAIRRNLQRSADLGVAVAVEQLGAIGFDWTLANADAARWVQQYTFELVSGIHATTQARLQTAVSEWIQNGDPLNVLTQELAPLFGRQRARMIAQTETTRAYAEGNTASYRRSGVVEQVEWRTANDERVCPTCGPLNGKRTTVGGTFEGGYSPPAHPRCRCWIVPVVGK
jgi:SPP1 gp7 family putative phage head morphogenesis protein